jgi:beta-galactosidase beta subunit
MRRSALPPFAIAFAFALAVALALDAAPARAEIVDASVTTLLAGRADARDGRVYSVVPAYEMLQLRLDDVHTRYVDLRVVVSAWGEVAFGDPRDGRTAGDVDIGYVEAAAFDRRITLRAGRQLVWAGGARVFQLDGGAARLRVYRRLYLDLYGGAPVTPRFAVKLGDAVAGGRASWRHSFDSEVGLSYLHVLDAGRVARQDFGADARWSPRRELAFTGYLLYSVPERRIADADVGATWQPIAKLDVRVNYQRTAPDLFLSRSSILSVFASETRDEAGGNAYVRPLPRLTFNGDYHFVFDAAGLGQRAGGRLTLNVGRAFQTLFGVEGRVLTLPGNGYSEARLFCTHRLSRALLVAVDFDTYVLQQPVNGATLSMTGTATVAWDFARGWRAVVTGLADTTPLVERRFEFLARLVYNHEWRFHQVRR